MNKVTTIPYFDTEFIWVCNHWDFHREGICLYNDEMHVFKGIETEWNEVTYEFEDLVCDIYKISFIDKLKWWWRQKKFELCIGYHYSYSNGCRGKTFSYRKPQWIFKQLFKLYYKIK